MSEKMGRFTGFVLCSQVLHASRGGYRISARGGRPMMDWCSNAIE